MTRYRVFGAIGLVILTVCYQNCSQTGFTPRAFEASSTGALRRDPSASPTPVSNTPAPTATPVTGTSPTPGQTATPTPTPPPAATPGVQFFGRFDTSDSAGRRYTWSGSSMVARFNGTSVSVTLNESSGSVYYVSVIDSQAPRRFAAAAGVRTYSLGADLAPGVHQVLLMRDTEGNEGGVSQFRGFTFENGGQLLAPPEFTGKYRLEVIGDSNTAGYGNLGTDPCTFSTATESAYHSYVQQTAQLLGAPPATNISYSGIGIYRNWGKTGPEAGFPAMPGFYPRTLTNSTGTQGSFSTDPAQQPTVVVINLGANDFWNGTGPSQADFIDAYRGLVRTIRSRYPNAYFIATIRSGSEAKGFVQLAANQIRADGEMKIRYLEIPLQDSQGPSGCNGHASRQAHSNSANVLAQAIQQLGL